MSAGKRAMVADHVAALMTLLGSEVILIACRRGTKKPVGKWNQVDRTHMTDPKYLAKLNNVNIGVVLGWRSGGLCTLDIDSDEALQDFLEENKPICQTLITRGNRGGNIWWKVPGSAPKLTPLKVDEKHWGEWRGDGAQTLIYGQHPSGVQYQILRRVSPMEIEFNEIRFPKGMTPTLLLDHVQPGSVTERQSSTETSERSENTEQSEQTERIEPTDEYRSGSGVCGASFSMLSFEDVLKLTVPTEPHQNHHLLFRLARWVKTFEEHEKRTVTAGELRTIFKAWVVPARDFLRKELGTDDYWLEFVEAYQRARFGLGVDPIQIAWEQAMQKPPPEAAEQFEEPGLKMLVSLCRELSLLSGGGQFFLASRTVQRVLGLNDHVRAARWLSGLCRLRILEIVEEGGPKTMRATRYLYLPKA